MTKREKNLIYAAVLIIIVAVYTMMVLPYIGLTEAKQGELDALQTEVQMQNQKLEALPDLERQASDHQGDLEELKNAYGQVKTQEEIATYFSDLVAGEGLVMTAFSQTGTNGLLEMRDLELFPMAEVTFTCRGDYKDYISMMDALNHREDITVLSQNYALQNGELGLQEYSITCLLLMSGELG